jgi:hypothetical protein
MDAAAVKRAGGQAIAEMLVVLLALIPLWLGILMLAGLQDIAITAQSAARYVAFDQALAPESMATSALRARSYLIDAVPGPVAAATLSQPGEWSAYPGPWHDPASGRRWLTAPSAVSIAVRPTSLAGAAGRASELALRSVSASAPLAPGYFDLQARGPGVATVSIAIDDLHLAHAPQPYVLAAQAGVLGGDWAADGPEQVVARVRGLAPLRVLTPVTGIIGPLTPLLTLFEPRLREFCPGTIAPEVVPPDRLTPRPAVRGAQWVRC